MSDDQYNMLLDWMRKIHQLEYANRYASITWDRWHNWLGIPAFLIVVGIALTYKVPAISPEEYSKLPFFLKQELFIAIGSIIVALLIGLQTFVRPSERAGKHRATSSTYEKLRHDIEKLTTEQNPAQLQSKIDGIKDKWDAIDSLNVSNKKFVKAKEMVKSLKRYPPELSFIKSTDKSESIPPSPQ